MVRRTRPTTGRPRGLVLLSLVMLLGSLAWAPRVSAASTLYVAQLPTAIGDGSSCASPGFNDIDAAVNAAVAGDTVHICAGTYVLPSFIFIQVDLTLRGDNAATTIIDGSGTRRLFAGAIGRTISFDNLTFQNGQSDGSHGGAIHGNADLTVNVTNSVFKDNHAVGLVGSGGAIKATTVNVTDSTFTGNTAVDNGGAIQAVSVSVSGSTFTGNTTTRFDGGAIYGVTVTVTDSTFSANHGTNAGGAILGVTTTIVESTFSANTTDLAGGAIAGTTLTATGSTFHANTAGSVGGAVVGTTATVLDSTFSANTAAIDGGAIHATNTATVVNSTLSANAAAVHGGAIHANIAVATNSTFDGNTSPQGGSIHANVARNTNAIFVQPIGTNNCLAFGVLVDGGGNYSTDPTCTISFQPNSHVVTPAQLALGGLASNGGPTQTIALGAASVARDAGIEATCAASPVDGLDQRGISRPQGAYCDSGAYEYVAPVAPPPAPAPPPVPPVPPVLTDSIAPGINRGSTGFGTTSIVLPTQGYVTYLVRLDPSLAGKPVEIWTRSKAGPWVKTTSRLVAADGTVHYFRRISAWTGFWAKLADGSSHGRIGTARSGG